MSTWMAKSSFKRLSSSSSIFFLTQLEVSKVTSFKVISHKDSRSAKAGFLRGGGKADSQTPPTPVSERTGPYMWNLTFVRFVYWCVTTAWNALVIAQTSDCIWHVSNSKIFFFCVCACVHVCVLISCVPTNSISETYYLAVVYMNTNCSKYHWNNNLCTITQFDFIITATQKEKKLNYSQNIKELGQHKICDSLKLQHDCYYCRVRHDRYHDYYL